MTLLFCIALFIIFIALPYWAAVMLISLINVAINVSVSRSLNIDCILEPRLSNYMIISHTLFLLDCDYI